MLPPEELRRAGVEQIIGTGSALGRNPILQEEMKTQFGLPVEVKNDVDAAFGAALVVSKAEWN